MVKRHYEYCTDLRIHVGIGSCCGVLGSVRFPIIGQVPTVRTVGRPILAIPEVIPGLRSEAVPVRRLFTDLGSPVRAIRLPM